MSPGNPRPGHRRGDGVERAAPSTPREAPPHENSRGGLVSYYFRRKTEVASVFQLGISIQRRLGWALLLRQRAPGGPADRERWWGSARKAGALRDEPAAAHSAAQGSHSQPWSA